MLIPFSKYHGAGNDFILVDDREEVFPVSQTNSEQELVQSLCNRRTGIGADGLILVRDHAEADFEMLYYNADGRPGSLCGNGGRCVTRFVLDLGLPVGEQLEFMASDGLHRSWLVQDGGIALEMHPPRGITRRGGDWVLDTGSPHYVRFVEDVQELDVIGLGKAIRHSPEFDANGINVNFAALKGDLIQMRTFERGVEDETLACGTGAVATALAHVLGNELRGRQKVLLDAPGGRLAVSLNQQDGLVSEVILEGPAQHVFDGQFECPAH